MSRRRREEVQLVRAVLRGREEAAFPAAGVSPVEAERYRAIAQDAVERAVRRASPFRRHERVRFRRPALRTALPSLIVAGAALAFAAWLLAQVDLDRPKTLPILGAAMAGFAIAAAALGWGISAWTTHSNARVRYTLDMVAKRYATGEFTEAMERFNAAFGERRATPDIMQALTGSAEPEERRTAQAVKYLLNYFELLAVGMMTGELDAGVVRDTMRANIVYVHDQCLPYVEALRSERPRTLEHLALLRRHFEEV